MNGSRLKANEQTEQSFGARAKGESRSQSSEGSEPRAAGCDCESQACQRMTMEAVCANANIAAAAKHVKSKNGSGGVDGMQVEQLIPYLREHWPAIREQLLDGTYEPQPVLRKQIDKKGGGKRDLGIPILVDRVIQQALLQVLQPVWDPTFSDSSYGFRPNRHQHQAIERAQGYITEGYGWVVDLDLEKFFDRVNHDRLMAALAKRISDKRILRVIRAYLTAGVMDEGLVKPTLEGTPQGGPLSPFLSNVVLDELDRELERRGHRFVRFADDCNIYVRSRRAGERVLESLRRFISHKLKLRVNEAKSAVDRPSKRKFLSFSFTPGSNPRRRIAPEAIERFKQRVRTMTRPTKGRSIEDVIAELNRYLRGWIGYFGFCQARTVLKDLDGWIRRRLRAFLWRQWKTGRQRFSELRKRNVSAEDARSVSGSGRGPWFMSTCRPIQKALKNTFFTASGLLSLFETAKP